MDNKAFDAGSVEMEEHGNVGPDQSENDGPQTHSGENGPTAGSPEDGKVQNKTQDVGSQAGWPEVVSELSGRTALIESVKEKESLEKVDLYEVVKDGIEVDGKYELVGDAEQGVSAYIVAKEMAPSTMSVKSLCTKPYAGMGKEDLLQFSQHPGWRAARWVCLFIIVAGWLTMIGFASYLIVSTPRCLPWWQSAVVYQIFPRSFRDSPAEEGNPVGGDGIGDFQGITDSVEYLQSLGINAILLNSIYKSGGKDNGEDIVDFSDVDEDLGTIEDFEDLVNTLHGVDIKVILDFIPNHSSVDHEFFVKIKDASDETPEEADYYTLNSGIPNNWASLYSGSAWTNVTNDTSTSFLHQYSVYQPDFNLENEYIIQYLTGVLDDWFTLGVDGFSVRGVSYYYEAAVDADNAYNEPPNPDYDDSSSPLQQYDATLHHYTAEYGGKSHDLLNRWREDIFHQFSTAGTYRVMLTDSNSNSTYAQTYYGTSADPEADLPMAFNLLNIGDPEGKGGQVTGQDIETMVKEWMDKMEGDENWPTFQLGNYGTHRIASRLSSTYTNVANILLLTLPGTPLCYYGDEIGMQDIELTSIDQVKDLRGLSDPDVWESKTRDYERSPMQWSTKTNAGFSEANSTDLYLPVHPDYTTINYEVQNEDDSSSLALFRRMISLRSENRALTSNKITFVSSSAPDEDVIAYIRELDSYRSRFLIALNFGADDSEVDYYTLDGSAVKMPLQGKVVVATDSGREESRVELNKLHLAPGEGVVVLLDEIVKVGSGWWYQFFSPDY